MIHKRVVRRGSRQLLAILAATLIVSGLSCALIEPSEGIPDFCQRELIRSTLPEPSEEKAAIPEPIIDTARQVILEKTGKEFFDRYVRYAPYHARAHPEDTTYGVTFLFEMDGKPFVHELVGLTVGQSGRVHTQEIPLPACGEQPEECSFPMDEMQAKREARSAGLAQGLGPLGSSFHWHSGYKTFVWVVRNLESYKTDTCSGRSVIIDANSGALLEEGGWGVIIN